MQWGVWNVQSATPTPTRFLNLNQRYYELLPFPGAYKISHKNSLLLLFSCTKSRGRRRRRTGSGFGFPNLNPCALPPPQTGQSESDDKDNDEPETTTTTSPVKETNNSATIISSCLVGLLTGIAVVLFNNTVLEIREFCWDGIPLRGASWLREEPIQLIWKQVILVPASGGFIVTLLTLLQTTTEHAPSRPDQHQHSSSSLFNHLKAAFRPFIKALSACVTLGTGNSLGPEGPSVEIGTSIAKGVATLFDKYPHRNLSLVAAGSAAGISSGFNAAFAGCFFAVESVLWPSPKEPSVSLTNTTSMVILSAVIASVVSEVGLGSEPAFKVPEYDFRSPSGNI